MRSLVAEFFRRDLSLREWDALEAELRRSPLAAQKLASLAEAAYLETGLPEPAAPPRPTGKSRWSGPRWIRRSGPLGPMMPVLVLALAGSGGAWLMHWDAPEQLLPLQAASVAAIEAAPAPLAPPKKPLLSRPHLPGLEITAWQDTVRISMECPKRQALKLEIRDSQGRLCRSLFRGELKSGSSGFVWDQRGNNGELVEPGIYYVCAAHSSGEERRALEIELR